VTLSCQRPCKLCSGTVCKIKQNTKYRSADSQYFTRM